jgi:hypothetical protein
MRRMSPPPSGQRMAASTLEGDFCAPVGAFGSSGWFAAASLQESGLLRLLKALAGDELRHAIGCIYFFIRQQSSCAIG